MTCLNLYRIHDTRTLKFFILMKVYAYENTVTVSYLDCNRTPGRFCKIHGLVFGLWVRMNEANFISTLVQVHVQNATLAGGVAIGTAANLMVQPFGAMLVGALAGTLSVIGFHYIQVCAFLAELVRACLIIIKFVNS